ncbi:MAG: transcriptional repressor [Clostridiales bacterium]|nr:transcriptional repressor [Clostridiales bacterium]
MKRNTTQRAIVYETVSRMHSHPSAETVYDEIKKKYPGIGRATVYRQLRDLAKEGRVRCVALSVGADRFDFTLRPHSHIVCRCCGRVEDVSFTDAPALAFPPDDPVSGFSVEGCDMIYRGLCPACREQADQ